MNQIFIGFDSGQQLAFEVCQRSIKKYNKNITIHKLIKKDLEQQNLFNRKDNTGATEFTYTRFLTPYLSNYEGWSLFCDSDFLWFCDPEELILQCKNKINQKAVYCVHHQYTECCSKEKMDGQKQEWYPKKNWSSLMIFNNSHPSIKNLSIENINTQTPKWLHRMEWCKEDEIGEVNKKYNYLVGYYKDNNYKALHFTDGGPWHPSYEKVEFGDLWLKELTYFERFKMNYKPKSEVLCVTSFNNKLYKEYAHKFLKTFNWPFDLLIYSEEDLVFQDKRYKTLNILKCDEEFIDFIKTNKTRKVKDFYYDGVRFSYKVFAVVHAGLNFSNYKYLMWLDADIIFKRKIDFINLEKYFTRNDSMMSYLGRYNYHSECGFLIFNLEHKYIKEYLSEMRRMYLSNDIYKEKEHHDSFIWDVVRLRFENKYKIKNFNLGEHYYKKKGYQKGLNIARETPLINYIEHLKGNLKKLNI